MSTTHEQRLAEATARRWRRKLEAMDGSDAPDERFCIVHRYCGSSEHGVVLLREGGSPPPTSQRS